MPRGLVLILIGLLVGLLGGALLPGAFGTAAYIVGAVVFVWGLLVLLLGLTGHHGPHV